MNNNANNMVRVHNRIWNAKNIEDVLCLATLIAKEVLRPDATLEHAIKFYNGFQNGCNDCPFMETCLACIINA
jgi:hypothetical protein